MTNYEAALRYLQEYKFSIIPVGLDKKPLIKWQGFQKEYPSSEQVKEWWDKWPDAGIGIVTGKLSDLAVIDIDEEQGYDEIKKLLPGDTIFPIVQSPSGGHHYYFRMPKKELRLNVRTVPGCDLRAEGGYIIAPPTINTKGKYRWQKSIQSTPIPQLPDSYIDFVCRQGVVTLSSNVVTSRQVSSSLFTDGRRDNDLFHVANCLVKGGMPNEEILEVLKILGGYCNFPEKELRIKMQSALERAERRERNLSEEVREWVLSSSGVFLSSDVVRCLQLSSRDELKNLSKILSRLSDEKIIEKHGNKNGHFRRVENDLEILDWQKSDVGEFPIALPLDIHKFVKLQPKNIIVVAGSQNSGKTAFLLNIVKDNMYKYNINYFSSEMSEMEFKERIVNFGHPSPEKWKFNAYNRCSNFSDVIVPDHINIIDFLELHDEFWRVGKMMLDIYEKLDKGIAIIALQKQKGATTGRGGEFTLEKPRLYISMDTGTICLEKAKNWRHKDINPNLLTLNFKLVQGSCFIKDGDWTWKGQNSGPVLPEENPYV